METLTNPDLEEVEFFNADQAIEHFDNLENWTTAADFGGPQFSHKLENGNWIEVSDDGTETNKTESKSGFELAEHQKIIDELQTKKFSVVIKQSSDILAGNERAKVDYEQKIFATVYTLDADNKIIIKIFEGTVKEFEQQFFELSELDYEPDDAYEDFKNFSVSNAVTEQLNLNQPAAVSSPENNFWQSFWKKLFEHNSQSEVRERSLLSNVEFSFPTSEQLSPLARPAVENSKQQPEISKTPIFFISENASSPIRLEANSESFNFSSQTKNQNLISKKYQPINQNFAGSPKELSGQNFISIRTPKLPDTVPSEPDIALNLTAENYYDKIVNTELKAASPKLTTQIETGNKLTIKNTTPQYKNNIQSLNKAKELPGKAVITEENIIQPLVEENLQLNFQEVTEQPFNTTPSENYSNKETVLKSPAPRQRPVIRPANNLFVESKQQIQTEQKFEAIDSSLDNQTNTQELINNPAKTDIQEPKIDLLIIDKESFLGENAFRPTSSETGGTETSEKSQKAEFTQLTEQTLRPQKPNINISSKETKAVNLINPANTLEPVTFITEQLANNIEGRQQADFSTKQTEAQKTPQNTLRQNNYKIYERFKAQTSLKPETANQAPETASTQLITEIITKAADLEPKFATQAPKNQPKKTFDGLNGLTEQMDRVLTKNFSQVAKSPTETSSNRAKISEQPKNIKNLVEVTRQVNETSFSESLIYSDAENKPISFSGQKTAYPNKTRKYREFAEKPKITKKADSSISQVVEENLVQANASPIISLRA